MISYSLVTNTNVSLDLIDRQALMEKKLEEFWDSPYEIEQIDEYCSLVCEGDLLLEFSLKDFILDNLSNVLQAAIGAALEAGITIGSLGVGAPAAAAAEALNDIIFFGYSVGDFVLSAKGIFTDLMDLKELIVQIFSTSIEDEPQDIYDIVQEAISGAGDLIERLGFDFDEMMEKITSAFKKLLTKVAKPAGDMVAIFVPVPGVDAIVQNLIAEFADDAFQTFIKYYDKIPDEFRELVHNPKKLLSFIGEGIDITIKFLSKMMTTKVSDVKGYFEKAVQFATDVYNPVLSLLKYSGRAEKVVKFLEGKARSAAEYGVELIQKIYPVLIAGLSAITVITSEDY